MRPQRFLAAVAALGLLTALNLLVWRQDFFSLPVLVAVAAAVVASGGWAVAALVDLASRQAAGPRAAGALSAVLSSAIFLCICLVVYALIESWGYSADLTEEGRRTLAPQTVQVLQALTEEVQVKCIFLQIDDELIRIARDKTLRFLEQCREYTDLLKVTQLDPQVDRPQLEAMNISHVAEQGTIVVAAGTRQKVITLSGGSPRLEERDFTNALINVLRGAQPKAYFLHGHSEREVGDKEGEDGAAAFVDLLQKEAYKVEVLDIDPNRPEVPEDCSILIINGPKSDLLPQEIAALEAYAGRGGRLLVLLNPLSQRQGGLAPTPNLVSWLQGALGVDVGVDLILTDVGAPQKVSQIQLTPDRTPFAALEEDPAAWQGSYRAQHPVTRAFPFKMVLTAVRTVSAAAKAPQQTIVTELVRTPPDYWAETDAARWIETKGSAEQNEGEKAGPIPIAVAAVKRLEDTPEEGRPGDVRAVVVGDADLMTNAQIQSPGNFNLIFNVMAWLSESEDLIAIRASGKEDPPIVLTPLQQRAVVWTSTLATLQAVIGVGLVVYVVRRKHR